MERSPLEGLENIVDLGGGYRYVFTTRSGYAGQRCGMLFEHPRPDSGKPCAGSVDFAPFGEPQRTWRVEQWEPLTLSPSLHCRACGRHGFIRSGVWVEA